MVNHTLLNFGKRYEDDLRVIFVQCQKLHLGLDALSNQKILNGINYTDYIAYFGNISFEVSSYKGIQNPIEFSILKDPKLSFEHIKVLLIVFSGLQLCNRYNHTHEIRQNFLCVCTHHYKPRHLLHATTIKINFTAYHIEPSHRDNITIHHTDGATGIGN